MAPKEEVVEAFETLGLSVDADRITASKAYKRLALIHHPDRNHGDATATLRFQQIGAAWNICQRHFDNPAWSQSSAHSTHTHHFNTDDDIPLDEELLHEFYMFMFAETLFNRYSRAKGQRYRYQRSGAGGTGVYTFSGNFAASQQRQASNTDRQSREKEAYEERMRDLEREIEEEARELERTEKKRKADDECRASAMEHAFQAALSGNSSAVQKNVIEFDLDVNAPRKRAKQGKQSRKQEDNLQGETLLHAAASYCDETLVMFLVERGAKPLALNKQQLSPFHAAILAGNTGVIRFIMDRRGKSFDGYHPSKAAPSGRTPLQLAIASGVTAMVELFIKDATTHDVERCWKTEIMSNEVKDVLRMKRGFVIPEQVIVSTSAPPVSKKLQRQQELAALKESRIAEEHERAANNRRKKEERAMKRAEEERRLAEAASRRKAESEERQRLEELRRAEEEKKAREQALQEKLIRAKRAAQEKVIQEERETQARLERERLEQEKLAREKLEREKIERQRSERQGLERQRLERERSSRKKLERETPSKAEIKPFTATMSIRAAVTATMPITSPPISNPKDEERKAARRAKMREKRKAKQAQRYQEKQQVEDSTSSSTKKPPLPALKDTENLDKKGVRMSGYCAISQHEATMRRRAEQSARDKERHRRTLAEYMPPTPVSTHSRTEYFMEDIQTSAVPDYLFVA